MDFKEYHDNDTPIRLTDFGHSSRSGEDSIVVNDRTSITVVDEKLPFPPPTKSTEPIDIADISKINNNELITVKGIAIKVMGTVRRKTETGYVASQDVQVGDNTGSVRFVLWESVVNTCTEGKSYLMTNVRVKHGADGTYITTPRDTVCTVDEIEDLHVTVSSDDLPFGLLAKTVNCFILGVGSVSHYPICCSCNRKLNVAESDEFVVCENCNMEQRVAVCDKHWFMQVLVKTDGGEKYNLSVFEKEVEELAAIAHVNLGTISSPELSKALLNIGKLQITCNERKLIHSELA